MGDFAIGLPDRRDDGVFVIHPAGLVAIDQLPGPGFAPQQGFPHGRILLLRCQPTLQDARILAQYFFHRVAADFGKRLIGVFDTRFEIGNDHGDRALLNGQRQFAQLHFALRPCFQHFVQIGLAPSLFHGNRGQIAGSKDIFTQGGTDPGLGLAPVDRQGAEQAPFSRQDQRAPACPELMFHRQATEVFPEGVRHQIAYEHRLSAIGSGATSTGLWPDRQAIDCLAIAFRQAAGCCVLQRMRGTVVGHEATAHCGNPCLDTLAQMRQHGRQRHIGRNVRQTFVVEFQTPLLFPLLGDIDEGHENLVTQQHPGDLHRTHQSIGTADEAFEWRNRVLTAGARLIDRRPPFGIDCGAHPRVREGGMRPTAQIGKIALHIAKQLTERTIQQHRSTGVDPHQGNGGMFE